MEPIDVLVTAEIFPEFQVAAASHATPLISIFKKEASLLSGTPFLFPCYQFCTLSYAYKR
jgi:hypothetical protein